WDRKKFSGTQLCGKTLGIIGLGRIGQEVASRAAAFGMYVLGHDPFLSDAQIENLRVHPVSKIDELLQQIDYLTVHTPLTPETKDLISTAQIATMKPGTRLINCARGGIYNEAALVEGLNSGQLAGVALDVYETEPCTDSPLFGMDGVLVTPHLGASTAEAQIQVATEAVELLIGYLQRGEIKSAVNTTAIDPVTLNALRGYLDAAYRLGIMLAEWHQGGIEKVELRYFGELARHDRRILTSAFCAGLLERASRNVNIINSQAVAKDRGVELVTTANEKHESLAGMITAKISGEGLSRKASVTVFGKDMPRLIGVGNFHTDAYIDGNLLVISHRDVPGVIGYIGEILGKEDINITQLAIGRVDKGGGGAAIGVLNLDHPASQSALDKVEEFPGIDSVDQVQLPPHGQLPNWLA
ncbi:MAG: NAD(P)-dependent oxidoreductase, partial [Pirellulaceae bacterium]